MEADGSRGLPLKYHRSFEPVVPRNQAAAGGGGGLSALTGRWGSAHGWREAGLDPGMAVTEGLMADLLLQGLEASGFRGRALVVLNQGDPTGSGGQRGPHCGHTEAKGHPGPGDP